MNIGTKIRELRRARDLTQDELAELLGVSYQAVSKWETGAACPDLSLIAPLARLFNVSADTLLGIDTGDLLRAEFDAAYENYWQKDCSKMYETAKRAVAEFPGDYKYLEWLASTEYYIAFDDDYRNGGSDEFFRTMLEQSRRHYEMVIEGCNDAELRSKSLFGIILDLKYLGRIDEAKQYAMMFPENPGYSRDMMLHLCAEEDERLEVGQRILYTKSRELLDALQSIWKFGGINKYTRAAVELSLTLIEGLIEDGNYLDFLWNLYQLYIEKAEGFMADGDADGAMECLVLARDYAYRSQQNDVSGRSKYTSTLLDRVDRSFTPSLLPNDAIDYLKYCLNKEIFNPIRGRADFIEFTRNL